jgi:hypothetical protein
MGLLVNFQKKKKYLKTNQQGNAFLYQQMDPK